MELLDRYQPLYAIGRGGMGTIELAVERGEGPASGPRVVALKRMLPAVRDRQHESMFLREARLATLLNHRNVVHAFAFGEHEGELIIAMEYVEGETLASLLEKTKLPLDVAALVLAEVCDGLDAAHELRDVTGKPLGVVHRDVSPQNVMLSYDGQVKLLDFGVAKLESAHLTKTGDVRGKTAYMSPEQAMSDPLDRRSDLYGVGAILFELVAGRRMWSGSSDIELLRQLALAQPPKLEEATPDAPRALCELHARLVAKKSADRPASAAEVAAALRAFVPDAAAARVALAERMAQAYGNAPQEKRTKLEAALAKRDEPANTDQASGLAVTAPVGKTSRVAPWLYAFVGAAVASAAVLALARTRPQNAAQAPSQTVVASSSVAPPASAGAPPAQTGTNAIAPAARPAPHRRSHAVRVAPSTAPAASAAKPPIDVDPNPI